MDKYIQIVIDSRLVAQFNEEYFIEHPRARNPKIKAPQHPSMNDYYKSNFQSANKIKQNWKEFIVWCLKDTDLAGYKINRCNITYTTYFKTNRRHDLDNISPKFILDGFVEAGLIVDDDYKHIESLTIKCGIDKENPRMEFLIEILD